MAVQLLVFTRIIFRQLLALAYRYPLFGISLPSTLTHIHPQPSTSHLQPDRQTPRNHDFGMGRMRTAHTITRLAVETIPSLAPKTAARNQANTTGTMNFFMVSCHE